MAGIAHPPTEAACGAVLAGGRSRRMGRDKALVRLPDGRALALVAAAALGAAGAAPVVAVGGGAGLAAVGLEVVADLHPGEGPLGGLLTALEWAPCDIVLVLACDLPAVTGQETAALLAALRGAPTADAAVALVDGVPQHLSGAYRRSARHLLGASFAAGERAVRRGAQGLVVVGVDGLDPVRLDDVDTPAALAAHLARGS